MLAESLPEDLKGLAFFNEMLDWNGKKEFGLDNITNLLEYLGNPQDKPYSVHIAGTNGKGSVATAVDQILRFSGFTVGLLTSPHLSKVNERIKLNGKDIGDIYLSECILKVQNTAEEHNIELTKHELITAASFLACQDMEWIVVEVGLGGRLDASNVLKEPKAASIVTIDFDHTSLLGSDLVSIAREKAGIIKEGQIVVVGSLPQEALDAIEEIAASKNAKVIALGRDYFYEVNEDGFVTYKDSHNREMTFKPLLQGVHQAHNMSVAAAVGMELGANIDECSFALEECNIPCRLEILPVKGKNILLDAAHNPAGIKTLISFLESEKAENVEILFGVFADKDWHQILDLLIPHIVKWNIVEPESKRALSCNEISNYLIGQGVNDVTTWSNLDEALETFVNSDNFLLSAGSINLVGKVREKLLLLK